MEHLKLVEQSLEEMEQKMDNEEEIDWTQMMNLSCNQSGKRIGRTI